MTKRNILFNATVAAMGYKCQSDPNSAYYCYGITDTKTRVTRKKKQIKYYCVTNNHRGLMNVDVSRAVRWVLYIEKGHKPGPGTTTNMALIEVT